jgi:hypothetical protein
MEVCGASCDEIYQRLAHKSDDEIKNLRNIFNKFEETLYDNSVCAEVREEGMRMCRMWCHTATSVIYWRRQMEFAASQS